MRVAVLLITLIALAGCGGDDAASVPKGFQRFDGPTYTFAHPAGWKRIEGKSGDTLGAQGPKGTGGLAPQAAVGTSTSPADFDTVIQGFKADLMTRFNWKVVKEEPYKLEGAEQARITEGRYDQITGDSTTPVRTIDVHAITKDGRLYDLVVRAPEADFDRMRLREVIPTFRLK